MTEHTVNLKKTTEKMSLYDLLEEVSQFVIHPEDQYEIAAVLESMGWNDTVAQEVFGVSDIFELAGQLWDASQKNILFVPTVKIPKKGFMEYTAMILRGFLRGVIFAVPMAVSIAAMLTLRFSLWSYINLSVENATSIAVGTIFSFVVVGGFIQAIAFWGFRFVSQEHYLMARKLVFYWVRLGYAVCLLTSAAVLIFNMLFSVFPWNMTIIMILYFLFLSAIWLSVSIMYILQKELTFTGLIIAGIFLVFVFFKLFNLNIIVSQVISLFIVSATGIIMAHYYFITTEKEKEKGINPPLPRSSVIFHISVPYFIYGSLYFVFLFVDRIMAWSTNSVYMPFLIWFRGEYELGLDLALIVMILPMGLVEAIVTELMSDLESAQKNCTAAEVAQMNQKYIKMYVKRMIYVAVFSLANALILYTAVKIMGSSGALTGDLLFSATSRFVFIWALAAYSIVGLPLMNSLVLFCLARPDMAYRPVVYACGTNAVIGFMLSRWIGHQWAAAGLLAGALVFAFFSSRQVIKLLRNLDYYLYAAL